MRIMTNSYVKSQENEKKYSNMDPNGPDFQKYQEELLNTMKMSTILKSLNHPKKKRR